MSRKALPLFFILYSLFFITTGCQESWKEKVIRETREMSVRDCPHYLTPGLIVDSLSFDPERNIRHTYYTLVDSLTVTDAITAEMREAIHKALLDEIKQATDLVTMRKHECAFHYHYRMQSDGHLVLEDSITAEEYE
ncbi:MAG: hypothetical protein HUK01_07355 [Bacteroidaceae bacterium]|nr:hypothetical protein [Bacteroidaceae bacterium]